MINIFLGYCENSIKKLFLYRIYIITEILNNLFFPILISFFLWRSIIDSNEIGYDLKQMMMYIIISNIILLFTQIHVEDEIEGDVKTYKLGQKMLLPINYTVKLVFGFLSRSLIRFLLIYFPFLVLAMLITSNNIVLSRVAYVPFIVIIAFVMNSLFSFIIGFLSFWTTEIWGIAAVRNLITGLLTGAVFPLDILPETMQNIMLCTPFPYITYIPAKLLTDNEFNMQVVKNGMVISIIWILVLAAVVVILKNCGMKRYTSSGG